MASDSPWGGNGTEGKGRSIIDVVGPWDVGGRSFWTGDSAYGNFQGTSNATPHVAGLALVFYDMYEQVTGSQYLNMNPGQMFAWMLATADRYMGSIGAKRGWGTDNRSGLGRARGRMFNAAGLDYPAYWWNYYTCIEEGETYYSLNLGTLLASTNDVKAVVWWYDPRIEQGLDPDDVDLEIWKDGVLAKVSQSRTDNKEMAMHSVTSGVNYNITLKIKGYDVDGDDSGCGQNSLKVYVAAMAEDSARDDGDGPTYSASTCLGVEPM